jgi:sodium transport system permease protein
MLQVALIAGPAIVMALLLTRRPAKTLLLQRPTEGLSSLAIAGLLAFVMHPLVSTFSNGIRTLYPISEQTLAKLDAMQGLLSDAPNIWTLLVLVALLPAICEELAFRGFILSGLSRMRNKWLAILVSSLFFGIAHQLLQQSITAFAVGMLIGFLAIQTKSIFTCMLYHLIHNSLPLLVAHTLGEGGGVPGLVEVQGDALVYGGPFVLVCFAAVLLLVQRIYNDGASPSLEPPRGLEPHPIGA